MKLDPVKAIMTNGTMVYFQTQVPDPKTYKQHFENKHPKSPLPPECLAVEG